ncbi:hypothetical protein PF011_g11080 [Phytophthora fragariae]|uniref:Uncharacterized protein n=1 Tax=Phytophthora fragariae TaxID=53985 RepID=A0A6A3KVM5_9STRA|nr:hypothetical protein PF011_g11080 [Phytophthora fragariae]
MCFWWLDWPSCERSPSSDSEYSTTNHFVLSSDVSLYRAAIDGAVAAVLVDARAEADSEQPLALQLWAQDLNPRSLLRASWSRIPSPLAPVLCSVDLETVHQEPSCAAPLLGTHAASDAATSGTGSGHAASIARAAATRTDPSGDQTSPRSSNAVLAAVPVPDAAARLDAHHRELPVQPLRIALYQPKTLW